MRRLLFLMVVLLGLAAGIGAGVALKPAPVQEGAAPETDAEPSHEDAGEAGHVEAAAIPDPGVGAEADDHKPVEERSYITIGEQTIVPVVEGERTRALMLFELAVDVDPAARDAAISLEPRLRDAFLRELLKMSSTGAFTSTYTEDWVMDELRRNLSAAARKHLGAAVREVLVLDVMRQEM